MLRPGRNESVFMNHLSVSVQTQNFLLLVCPGGLFLLQGSVAEKKNGAEPDKDKENRSRSCLGNSGVHPIKTSHFLLNAFFFSLYLNGNVHSTVQVVSRRQYAAINARCQKLQHIHHALSRYICIYVFFYWYFNAS